MGLAWKFLFPLGLINLFVTAAEVLAWGEPTGGEIWLMAGINWTITVACLVISSHLVSAKLSTRSSVLKNAGNN